MGTRVGEEREKRKSVGNEGKEVKSEGKAIKRSGQRRKSNGNAVKRSEKRRKSTGNIERETGVPLQYGGNSGGDLALSCSGESRRN